MAKNARSTKSTYNVLGTMEIVSLGTNTKERLFNVGHLSRSACWPGYRGLRRVVDNARQEVSSAHDLTKSQCSVRGIAKVKMGICASKRYPSSATKK
jgi:hypothetical protein